MKVTTNFEVSMKGRTFLYKLSYYPFPKGSMGLVIINIHGLSAPKFKAETFKTLVILLKIL
jgi:hypothetical protein